MAELGAARLDGDVFELGRGFLPADAPETPAFRGATLVSLYGSHRAAIGLSAAWVHGAADREPDPHLAQSLTGRRREERPPRLRIRDRPIEPEDVVVLGGLLVSTPAMTLADLASGWSVGPRERVDRSATPDDARDGIRTALLALARDAETLEAAVAWLEARRRRPGRRVGLATLERLRRGDSLRLAVP